MSTILNFPITKLKRQYQGQSHIVLEQRLFKLTALPDDSTLLLIQNALEEARLNHDWRASRKKIECAIRRANLSIVPFE